MKRFLLFIICLFPLMVFGQYQTQYSQYMLNYFLINPGAIGMDDVYNIQAAYRKQWSGFNGAPESYYISANMPINKEHALALTDRAILPSHHALGVRFNGMSAGPVGRHSFTIAYGYHTQLSGNLMLSAGIGVGGIFYALDRSKIDFVYTGVDEDPSVAMNNKFEPDVDVGLFLYNKKFFFSLSGLQLISSDYRFSNTGFQTNNRNVQINISGGYKFKLSDKLQLVPSALLKWNNTGTLTPEVNTLLRYNDLVWLGASYRYQDAVAILAGVRLLNKIEIGYAYDVTTSNLSSASSGSHEILLGIRFAKQVVVRFPADYW